MARPFNHQETPSAASSTIIHAFTSFCIVLSRVCSVHTNEMTCGGQGTGLGTLRMGIVLLGGGPTVNDYTVMGPAIDLAFHRVKQDFNLTIEPVLSLYQGGCVEDGLAGLTQLVSALSQCIDVLLGPACTADLPVAAKLTTVGRVPLMTGAGSLMQKPGAYRYFTRTGYNMGTQWAFFSSISRWFDWKNVVVLYESDAMEYALNGQCT